MLKLIRQHQSALEQLCNDFAVKQLDVFGSAATGSFDDAESDLDFLVVFGDHPHVGPFDQYFGFLEGLQKLFGRPVDLVEAPAMRNPYFIQAVAQQRKLVYAA